MPSLSGTIQDSSGNPLATDIVFMQANSSLSSGSIAYRPAFARARSDLNGKFSVSLAAGVWDMAVNGFSTLQLTMPSTNLTYNVSDVLTATIPTIPTTYLPLAGGTMTGAIVLSGDPTLALHPVSKQYLEAWTGSSTIVTIGTLSSGAVPWSLVTTTPTTLAGYGITDAAPLSHVGSGGAAHADAVAAGASGFMTGADKTKLDGIGSGANVTSVFGRTGVVVAATNDYTWAQVNKATSSLADITTRSAADLSSGILPDARMPDLTGDVTTSEGAVATTIAARAVTFAKMQAIATSRLLGRTTASSGDIEELTASATKTLLSLDAVENTAISTWSGSTNLVVLGTVTGGTWNATAITAAYGGTGLTSYTQGDLIYASASTTLSKLGKSTSSTRYLSNTGTDNNPAWAQIDLSNGVTGDLPFSNIAQIATARILGRNTASTGDIEELSASTTKTLLSLNNVENTALSTWTGSSNIATVGTISSGTWNGSIIASAYGGTGNGFTKFSGPATSEKTFTLPNASCTILTTNAAVTAAQGGTGQTTYDAGEILVGNGSGSLDRLGIGTNGHFLKVVSGSPAWAQIAYSDLSGSGSTNITTVGTITSGTWNGTDIAFSNITQIATARILGRNTAGTGDIEELSASTTKTLLSLNNVENTALSTWAGTTNITTLGTVTLATFSGATCYWEGSTVDVEYGGTGADLGSSYGSTGNVLGIVYKQNSSAMGITAPAANSILVTAGDSTPSLSTSIPTACRFNSNHIVNASSSSKTTAGAPYTNDGYVTVVINGTNVKVMTTA